GRDLLVPRSPRQSRQRARGTRARRPHRPPPPLNGPGYAPRQAVRGAPERGLKPAPRRLGHVLLFTSDIARQVDLYTRVLGLKLSDRSQEIIAFTRFTP